MTARSMKIAYVLKGFPRLSETFIANEVRILSKKHMTLGLFSIKRGDKLARDSALPPVQYLPAVTSLSGTSLLSWLRQNLPKFSGYQSYWLLRHPCRYLGTLSFAIRCAIRYRAASASWVKKAFIKEFLFATCIARSIRDDSSYLHIHAHFCHDATTVAWMVSQLTGLPFSFTAHAKDIYKKQLNPGDLLERKLAAAKFAVTCTHSNVDHLRNFTAAPNKIHGIYHGLNINQFVPPQADALCRNSATVTPRLLAVGRLVEKKGFKYLIEACRILHERKVSFHLDIVGERGDQSDAVARAIRAYRLRDQVSIRPAVPQADLLAYYQSAAVFVLPCVVLDDGDRDGIPNVMAEAMACALPVVVSNISGIPELVENGVNGVLVPTRDAESLADALQGLIRNSKSRTQLGTAARQKIQSVFDAETTHNELQKLFDDVIGHASRA
jgi:glycosyltransferase involved in cell wall biosynthesis